MAETDIAKGHQNIFDINKFRYLALLPLDIAVILANIPGTIISILHLSSVFIEDIVTNLMTDHLFKSIYKRLVDQYDRTTSDKDGPSLILHNFHLDPHTKLIYFQDTTTIRLVMPVALLPYVLYWVHDNRTHVGIYQIHHFL